MRATASSIPAGGAAGSAAGPAAFTTRGATTVSATLTDATGLELTTMLLTNFPVLEIWTHHTGHPLRTVRTGAKRNTGSKTSDY